VLFVRKSNAISLTAMGRAFLTDVAPGLRILAQATNALTEDTNELMGWMAPAPTSAVMRYTAGVEICL
jgi:DNA-binding transcriptional LysR family regulator